MPIKKIFILLSCVILVLALFFVIKPALTQADELDDINKQLATLNNDLNKSIAATKPVESELKNMQQQIANIKNKVIEVERGIVVKKSEIDEGYKKLEDKKRLIAETISSYYINSYYDCPICEIFSFEDASNITLSLAYQRAKTNQDKQVIINLALSLTGLEKKKADLEREQKSLTIAKASLDEQSVKLDKIVSGAKGFQSELSGKIAALSAQQQSIVNAKSGGSVITLGSGELADEYLSSAKGFRESAPAGSFAIFSFGAHSHRNGMSQYGARGRAAAGQNYEQILKAYYSGIELKKVDNPTISVTGTNTYGQTFNNESYALEEYLKHIYEVPASWPSDVLKAQAIAARSYAYGKSSICSGQRCQEFKREENSESWKQAIKDTEGIVMTGGPNSYQYSSTSGGYLKTSGWDTTDGSGGNNFTDRAYEKLGGSPWLYKAWWREGTSNGGSTCGRSNPWLSPQEMADVYNAAKYRDGRVTPVTTACWGGNPYSMDELRSKAGSEGVSSVSNVTVLQGNGITNQVIFQTDKGQRELSASQFKEAVNVRAPGYIAIPQSPDVYGAPFFNIERK